MNLQEFIKTALIDIVAGVADASTEATKHGASIGSTVLFGNTKDKTVNASNLPLATVEFDIALAEGSSKDTKAGIGVYLGAIGLGSQGASHGETTSHSRIKFSVPVVFPVAKG
jgi:hypothetical protein